MGRDRDKPVTIFDVTTGYELTLIPDFEGNNPGACGTYGSAVVDLRTKH